MTTKGFRPLLNPSSKPAPSQKPSFESFIIKDTLTLPTLLALGALTQTLLAALLPTSYALLPLAFLLSRALISTLLSTRRATAASSPLLTNTVPGRATAQLPLPNSPSPFGASPAATPIVAFHLGVTINHPLGLLAPGGAAISAHFQAMTAALLADPQREAFGLVSTSTWRGTDRASGNSILMIAYFRDLAGLHRFAHGEVHRAGWDWYSRFVRETGYRHFGIFHETFAAGRGDWETVYVDCAPSLLGAGSVWAAGGGKDGKVEEEEGEEEEKNWLRTLVSADHPALKTQAKRMGLRTSFDEAVGGL